MAKYTPIGDKLVAVDVDEFQRLVDADNFLDALQAAGVDNWEGYSIAWQIYSGELNEDDI